MHIFGTRQISLTLWLILFLVIIDFLALEAQDVTNNEDPQAVIRKGSSSSGGHASGGRSSGGRGSSRPRGSGCGGCSAGKKDKHKPAIPREVALILGVATVAAAASAANAADAMAMEEAAKWYLGGVPRPQVQPDDPPDDVINQPLDYQGAFIYEHNPCQWYQERLKSYKNKRRKKGCRKAAKRFRKKAKDVPSARCPDPGSGRCFQITNHTGRCYIVVNDSDETKVHYELINRC